MIEKVIGATVVLVAIYLMVRNADGANKVITSLASGYGSVVANLQGRGESMVISA